MELFNNKSLEEYKKNDIISNLLKIHTSKEDDKFSSNIWLTENISKRLIYFNIYGDLLTSNRKDAKILDVGGGYTGLTKILMKNRDYCLLDIMAHDNHDLLKKIELKAKRRFWINQDWNQYVPKTSYDIIIANDLFPNVDQRIELFLERYIPLSKEIRLSLTFYNSPRFYKVKRTDADEIFFIVPWDGQRLDRALHKYSKRITSYRKTFFKSTESIFANGRIVISVKIKGNL